MLEVMQKFRQMTPYERRIILLLGISALTNCFSTFLQMVTNYSPKYHCDYAQELKSIHPDVYEKVTYIYLKKSRIKLLIQIFVDFVLLFFVQVIYLNSSLFFKLCNLAI